MRLQHVTVKAWTGKCRLGNEYAICTVCCSFPAVTCCCLTCVFGCKVFCVFLFFFFFCACHTGHFLLGQPLAKAWSVPSLGWYFRCGCLARTWADSRFPRRTRVVCCRRAESGSAELSGLGILLRFGSWEGLIRKAVRKEPGA